MAGLGPADDLRELFKVGDVISMPSPHWSLPKELEGRYFRVEVVSEHGVKMSRPYTDAECTVPYQPKPPKLDRRALPPDGPSVGADVPGGGACD